MWFIATGTIFSQSEKTKLIGLTQETVACEIKMHELEGRVYFS